MMRRVPSLGINLHAGLNEQLDDLGNDAVIKAGVHFTCAVDYARAGGGLLDGEAEVIFFIAAAGNSSGC